MRPALLLVAAMLVASPVAAARGEGFDIAVTVDDLPVHGPLAAGATRLAIARSYVKTLKAHRVKEAFGFVNALGLEQEAGTGAVLDAWRQAGFPLGNHGFAHLNLDRAASPEAWAADVRSGEAAVAGRMRGRDWRVYRFPNLAAGSEPARHAFASAWLAEHGYRVAHVSLAFSDWSYEDAYARCLGKGDKAAISAMKAQYLKGVDDGIARMKAVSARVYGRQIPQVLLTHIGHWAATMLPEVMARLEAAGARYVPLADTQSDPAYAEAERIPGGGGIMERKAQSARIDLSGIVRPAGTENLRAVCR